MMKFVQKKSRILTVSFPNYSNQLRVWKNWSIFWILIVTLNIFFESFHIFAFSY